MIERSILADDHGEELEVAARRYAEGLPDGVFLRTKVAPQHALEVQDGLLHTSERLHRRKRTSACRRSRSAR